MTASDVYMPPAIAYSDRFQHPNEVAAYEATEYGADSYSSHIWRLQQPVLAEIVEDFRAAQPGRVRLLDFACGTGRVLSWLEPLVDAAEGVDVSSEMIALAVAKCPRSQLRVGDVLAQPGLLSAPYHLITSFRFLLNVEPELRGKILRRLREVIHPSGRLVVNVHGNSRSLRHPAILWRRWRGPAGVMLNEMSPVETRRLLWECGFEITRQHGFGMVPPTLYRTPLRRLAGAVDRRLAGNRRWNDYAIDLMFVCRPI